MLFAKVKNGVIEKYPYTASDLRADNPQTSFPSPVPDSIMLEFGATRVVETAAPVPNQFERVTEAAPVLTGGVWRQQWVVSTVPPPRSITPRQCRLILMSQGLLPTVEAMIAQQDEATRITWEYALEFRRDDPLLTQLAANLNLTNEQIDQFFIAASQL